MVLKKLEKLLNSLNVKGMLPHNSLGRQQFKKLKVYKGADHPHAAQNPVLLSC